MNQRSSTDAAHHEQAEDDRDDGEDAVSVNWDAQPLGQRSDADIARTCNVAISEVRKERIRRGIPAYVECRGKGPAGKSIPPEEVHRLSLLWLVEGVTLSDIARRRDVQHDRTAISACICQYLGLPDLKMNRRYPRLKLRERTGHPPKAYAPPTDGSGAADP